VAGQFEALFIQQLLKNMRAGELGEPLFGDSDQHRMYQEMMDQQLAANMSSGRGIGLADMLVHQLGGEAASIAPTSERFFVPAVPGQKSTARRDWTTPENFVRDLWPHAARVAERLNVAPEGILAQAALETGWGAHVIARDNGASSNNLFGIKAGGGWAGGSVSRPTIEYIDGVAEYRVEKFRAYPDIAATFDDYARLIEENPRYSSVRDRGGDPEAFARALQDSGYATDPLYAAKISRVLNGETLRAAIDGLRSR
jgi:flagellar protein FlgJ